MAAVTSISISKICILVLGFIIFVLGLFSHFNSSWVKTFKLYLTCDIPGVEKCPKISLERYFVSMIIITFFLSIVSFVAELALKSKIRNFKFIDAGYHAVAALLVFIAAIVYLVSATQIKNEFGDNEAMEMVGLNFRTSEKLAAGSLTIFQALLYGATALLIFKQNDAVD